MNVEHAAVPALHEFGGEQPHEPRQANQVDLVLVECRLQRRLERRAILAEGLAFDRDGRDTARACLLEATGIGASEPCLVFGKLFPSLSQAERTYGIMSMLWNDVFAEAQQLMCYALGSIKATISLAPHAYSTAAVGLRPATMGYAPVFSTPAYDAAVSAP